MLRILSILLILMFPIFAEEVPPSVKPPAAPPAIAIDALVGSWHLDMEIAGGVRVKAVTEYKAGGTFQSLATVVMEEESTEMVIKGTWRVDGTTLVTTVTESDSPDLLPVGEVSKDEILELSDTTFRYRDEDGLVVRETRPDPKVMQPAKAPGKPVPPEEVKTIHAAIAAMERNFRAADYDGLVHGTHSSLIDQAGGEEKFRKSLQGAVGMLQSGKIKLGEVQLEIPTVLHEAGEEWVCFIPKSNTLEADGRTVRIQGFYVAIRKTTEKDWKLLDGAGFRGNPEMLWTLLPALPRDVVIPAIKREVIEE